MQEAAKLYILSFEDMVPTNIPSPSGMDRREMPRYSVSEVALYLHLPEKTLRSWLWGRSYTLSDGTQKFWKPVIEPANREIGLLSFYNLVEAHILKSTRERDEVPMSAVRDALDYVAERSPSIHPLITGEFQTEGRHLFSQRLGELVNLSRHGQLAFEELMGNYLERIDRDILESPSALYPFIPNNPGKRTVVIKPGVSSGVPTISGTGISIPILYGRYKSGDSIEELADDYELEPEEVRDSIAYLEAA
jgi:uncharacterized protein (DUF433 family)